MLTPEDLDRYEKEDNAFVQAVVYITNNRNGINIPLGHLMRPSTLLIFQALCHGANWVYEVYRDEMPMTSSHPLQRDRSFILSNKVMALTTGVSEQSVSRAVKELSELKLIECRQREGKRFIKLNSFLITEVVNKWETAIGIECRGQITPHIYLDVVDEDTKAIAQLKKAIAEVKNVVTAWS